MCGRFTLTIDPEDLQDELGFTDVPSDLKPRFNIAPSQSVLTVADPSTMKLQWLNWGLIPFWTKKGPKPQSYINARAETIAEKPSFKQSFLHKRCLIPADGFYEWQRQPGRDQPSIPHYFALKGQMPFAFAGIWDEWTGENAESLVTCAIITCAANPLVAQYHHRMPVILVPDEFGKWLGETDPHLLAGMLKPFPDDHMDSVRVSRIVNSPAVDLPDCIVPVPEGE